MFRAVRCPEPPVVQHGDNARTDDDNHHKEEQSLCIVAYNHIGQLICGKQEQRNSSHQQEGIAAEWTGQSWRAKSQQDYAPISLLFHDTSVDRGFCRFAA